MPSGIYDRTTSKPRKKVPVEERLLAKVVRMPEGCWQWTGSIVRGYGQMKDANHQNKKAHRVSFELYNGNIPRNAHINHLCRNKLCVNPAHLEAVTIKENIEYRDHNLYRWYSLLDDTLPSCRTER